MDDFSGKTVWVTGANQGIGQAVAEKFYDLGARVIGFDCRFESLELVERPFRTVPLDISDPNAVTETCQKVLAQETKIDVLINVAGVLRLAALEALSHEDWAQSFAVNVSGPFYLMRELIPVFKRQKQGCIVSVSSNAAHVPRMQMAAYGASKAALTNLTMTAGLELSPYGVRCNVVSPGSTDTPMLRNMWTSPDGETRTLQGSPDQYKLGIPLGKLAVPEDIAQTVVFLASPAAGHITMEDIIVDGGATLGK